MANNNESKANHIRTSRDGQWTMLESDGGYFFAHSVGKDSDLVKTPAGNAVRTSYRELADRILNDLDRFGYNYWSTDSIMSFHFSMIDNFARMDHSDVQEILEECFLQRYDWTFELNQDDKEWTVVLGEKESRNDTIRKWLSNCTKMQMTAAFCMGNAYHSINIAFVLARLMENFGGDELKQRFFRFAQLIEKNSKYGPAEVAIDEFTTFELYYGIHLKENGKIINEVLNDDEKPDKYIGSEVSFKDLIGRNFYLYRNGKIEDPQPFELNLPDLELDTESNDVMTDEYEDDFEDDIERAYREKNKSNNEDCFSDEDKGLAEYLPEKCWVKRISAVEDGYEAYYYLAALSIDDDGRIDAITVILEEVQRAGVGWIMLPGAQREGSSNYLKMDYYPDEVIKELDLLVKHRALSKDFSFIGKRLPQAIIDDGGNGGSNTGYAYALQSAYRMAYMHMSINTDESGIIKNFYYSSYKSSGSAHADMFSRPQCCKDRSDEAVDMLLYILDRYTDQEYENLK